MMKRGKKMFFKIFLILLAAFCTISLLFILFIYRFTIQERKKVLQLEVRLLCKTDHHALLEACREVSRMYARGDLKKSQYWIRDSRNAEEIRACPDFS